MCALCPGVLQCQRESPAGTVLAPSMPPPMEFPARDVPGRQMSLLQGHRSTVQVGTGAQQPMLGTLGKLWAGWDRSWQPHPGAEGTQGRCSQAPASSRDMAQAPLVSDECIETEGL